MSSMLNPMRDDDLLNFCLAHGGVVDLAACETGGISIDKLRWLIASGRWQSVYPRTFATFSGPLPYPVRLAAVLVYAGPDAALSHETAGAEYGICRQPESV